MHDEHRGPLDDAIDEVARSLTSAPLSHAMRGAIRARVDLPTLPRATHSYVGLAAAAAVIVVIVLLWSDREQIRPIRPPSEAAAEMPFRREALRPQAEIAPAPPQSDSGPRVSERSAVLASQRTTDTPIVEPLREFELLELRPLEVEALEIPMLVLEGLDVDPLRVEW